MCCKCEMQKRLSDWWESANRVKMYCKYAVGDSDTLSICTWFVTFYLVWNNREWNSGNIVYVFQILISQASADRKIKFKQGKKTRYLKLKNVKKLSADR